MDCKPPFLKVPWSTRITPTTLVKSFPVITRALGKWTGPLELEPQYAFPNSPTVFCNQIKLLFISGLRMQCSGIQCSQSCSRWMNLHGSQITQLMVMVAYHPAASQIACKLPGQLLGVETRSSIRLYESSKSIGCGGLRLLQTSELLKVMACVTL